MKKIALTMCAAVIVAAPSAAPAQFGGFAKKMLGGDEAGSVTTAGATDFLSSAMRSTKNVMISAALLAQAVTNRAELGGRKAEIASLQGAQDIKELDAHKTDLQSNLAVLSGRSDLAADLTTAYNSGTAQQRKVIGTAIANLAIGVMRNAQLAGQAPGMVKGIGSNPELITRAGHFKTAASLIGLQAKGLGGIATAMPKLLAAVKAKAPTAGGTSDFQNVTFD